MIVDCSKNETRLGRTIVVAATAAARKYFSSGADGELA